MAFLLFAAVLSDGSLRLADGGSKPYSGRLEVHYKGRWGTICNDFWEKIDGTIACNQLGFEGFTDYLAPFPPGSVDQPILLDNVKCFGYEPSLSQCSHKGFGIHNCNHTTDVGIECTRGQCDDSLAWPDLIPPFLLSCNYLVEIYLQPHYRRWS